MGLWDVASGVLQRTFAYEFVSGGILSPDGRYVAVGLDVTKDNLPIFDAATGERLRVIDHRPGGVTGMTFAPDSRHILTGSRDNITRIIDVETGEIARAHRAHEHHLGHGRSRPMVAWR